MLARLSCGLVAVPATERLRWMPGWSAEEWIQKNEVKARKALKDPEVAAQLYALLGGTADPSEQHKRLEGQVRRYKLLRRLRQ